ASAAKGEGLNLEAALKAGAPMGGHIVQGHIDGVGRVASWKDLPDGSGRELTVRIPDAFTRYCVEKGSIALNGVSLTIASIDGDAVRIALVPHTLSHTNLGRMQVGARIHFEVDVIGKYVEKLLGYLGNPDVATPGLQAAKPAAAAAASTLDAANLGKWGYGV
ncbi:MAG: hypothetical protein ABIW76_11600, partial [Fibrobacteria bacterium]